MVGSSIRSAGSRNSTSAANEPEHAGIGDSKLPTVNLWVVNQYAAEDPSPGLTRHHLLARAMRPYGVQSTIISDPVALRGPEPTRPKDPEPGIRFVWIRTRQYQGNGLGRVVSMLQFAWRAALLRGPRAEPPTVVVGSSPQLFAALAGWILARRHRVPFVLEIRDLWPESLIAILGVSRYHPMTILLRLIERFLYRNSDHIVGVLDGVGDYVRMKLGDNAPPVTYIPNGIDLGGLPEPGLLRPDPSEFRFVYAGAHGPPNGIDTLLAAAEILERESAPTELRVRFDLYGEGVLKQSLMQMAADREITSVHFHDPVPKDRVFGILQEADGLVLVVHGGYLFRFGFSMNKLCDYFAAARPVVMAVDAPGDPVSRAGAGYRAVQDPRDLAQQIRRLIRTPPEERQAMARRGRRYADEYYDINALGERFAATLRAVTAAR